MGNGEFCAVHHATRLSVPQFSRMTDYENSIISGWFPGEHCWGRLSEGVALYFDRRVLGRPPIDLIMDRYAHHVSPGIGGFFALVLGQHSPWKLPVKDHP